MITESLADAAREVFTQESEGESAIGIAGITCTSGADGKVTGVLVADLTCVAKGGHSPGKQVGGGSSPPLTPPPPAAR